MDLVPFVATAAFGLTCGFDRRRWPWAHVLFTAVSGGFLAQALSWVGLRTFSRIGSDLPLAGYWAFLAAVGIASTWEPLVVAFRSLRDRPVWLVVAVNALNVADAIMTQVAVRSGGALELNPLVRFGGLPLKIVLVAALTWILFRRRPSALLWPAVALAWVVCYHLSGLVVNG